MSNTPLPALFITEGILKIFGGATFLIFPSAILRVLQEAPYPATSSALIRNLGTQTLAFSIPLFLAARNDHSSVRSRKAVYWTLLGREGFLALGLLGQIAWSYAREWKGSTSEREPETERLLEEGLGEDIQGNNEVALLAARKLRRGLRMWIAELSPFILGRIWILVRREQWFD